jgi:hypothetical protein
MNGIGLGKWRQWEEFHSKWALALGNPTTEFNTAGSTQQSHFHYLCLCRRQTHSLREENKEATVMQDGRQWQRDGEL